MKLIPNTDPRAHFLVCQVAMCDEQDGTSTEVVWFERRPIVAWRPIGDFEFAEGFDMVPIASCGYVPEGTSEDGAVRSLIYFPHDDLYGDRLPFQVEPMSLEEAKGYLADLGRQGIRHFKVAEKFRARAEAKRAAEQPR